MNNALYCLYIFFLFTVLITSLVYSNFLLFDATPSYEINVILISNHYLLSISIWVMNV
jgi:hypothetical protein